MRIVTVILLIALLSGCDNPTPEEEQLMNQPDWGKLTELAPKEARTGNWTNETPIPAW